MAETVRQLRDQGHHVILISSGAVGVGCQRLGLDVRPTEVSKKQALAAVGQVHLMRFYDDLFSAMGMTCSQVLLTLDNLVNRNQYLNARNTFQELLSYGVVPVVNENDTVAVDQLRIGNNDSLAAQVATLVKAEWLFLLTDVDALYTDNPMTNPDAKPIPVVTDMSQLQHIKTSDTVNAADGSDGGGGGAGWGTGGMATKLTAAHMATAAGCRMVIASADACDAIPKIIGGERLGTVFLPAAVPVRGRKRWILSVPVKGEVWLDATAVRACKYRRRSVFPNNVLNVQGQFNNQDAVSLCDSSGKEFARGLVTYGCLELDTIKGMNVAAAAKQLGFQGSDEVVHAANICLMLARDRLIAASEDESDDDEDEFEIESNVPSRTITPPLPMTDSTADLLTTAAATAAYGNVVGKGQHRGGIAIESNGSHHHHNHDKREDEVEDLSFKNMTLSMAAATDGH